MSWEDELEGESIIRGTPEQERAAWRLAMRVEHIVRPRLPDAPRVRVAVVSETVKQLLVQELHFQVAAKIDFEVGSGNYVHPVGDSDER